ncbi:MAG: autotransporter assembly complex protein TamA [Gammaproteobacteria bacterium]|nr:autotransporter assembly complex protein TamA [Gammaproteobacteria bacterium]
MPTSGSIPIAWAAMLSLSAFTGAAADVTFTGLDDRLETNVRALTPLATTSCDSARWRVERLYRDADKNIGGALQALGYYAPTISKSLSWDETCWHASFEIQVGEPVRLRNVDIAIDGAAAKDKDFLSRIAPSRPVAGDVLDHGRYTAFKSSIMRAAINMGYFDADYSIHQVAVDRESTTADLVMRFQSGPKYDFGAVTFTEGVLRNKVLQGYTDIKAGDPYSAKAINDLYEALNGSSYFASVSISTEPLDTTDKVVPVNVSLTPAKRRIYSAGGGFTTDTGPNGRLGFANRRINDKGHQFDSKLFVSPVKSELNASYRWPRKDPRREWFSIVAGLQHEETDTSEHDSYKVGILRSKNIGTSWLQTLYADYVSENFKVGDQDTSSQLIIFGTNWETAKGRALSRATRGYRFNFDVRGASDALGSDTSFLQLRTSAKWIHSLGAKTRILARANLGTTVKDDFTELPASVRFFAGGDRSVRGYEFESLGPVNANGDVIGGSNLIDASLEIDRVFREKWAIAAFVDTGSAFDETDFEFSTGIGVGVRWYSPVGPIRLDIAHPLDNPDENFRIHISLGPDL